jgi:hypothetical protein
MQENTNTSPDPNKQDPSKEAWKNPAASPLAGKGHGAADNVVPMAPISDPGVAPKSKYAAAPLKVGSGALQVFTNVVPDYPREYCRSFPAWTAPAWLVNTATTKDMGKKLFVVLQDVVDAGGLEGAMHKAFYASCTALVDRDSTPHLWCVRQFDKDGNQLESFDTAMRAIEATDEEWHRIYWAVRGYNTERHRNPEVLSYRMPENLKTGDMDAWFEGAFPGRVIRDRNQIELKRIRGEA